MEKSKTMLFATAVGVCCNVFAAESEYGDSTTVYNLRELEIVATRAADDTPVAFTNVDAAAISAVNTGVDVPMLLLSTPSVISTSDAGAGIGYSSVRVRGTDGSRINVTANGIPVNDAESHNVYWVNLPDFASSLKDIQIQRGAGTSSNGAGAFGASINMQTVAPSSSPYSSLDAGYGTYNSNRQTLRVGSGLVGDHWIVDARISHIGSDGYIERASSRLWSYFGQVAFYNGAMSLKLLAFGGNERTYQAWDYASRQEMEEFGRRYNPCGKYTAADGSVAYYPNQYDNYTQHNFQLVFNHSLSPRLRLNAALHYTPGNGYYEQYKTKRSLVEYGLTPFYDADGNKVSKSDLVRYKKMKNGFGGAVFSVKYDDSRFSGVAGGAVNNYKGHHFGQVGWVRNYIGAIDPLQEYYRNTGEKLDANVYVRGTLTLWRGLSAYADMQYRYIDYSIKGCSDTYDWNTSAMQRLDIIHHYNFFNPKGGLNYRIGSGQRAYASLSVVHKEPTRDNFVDADPDRQPVAERLTDWELGYSYEGKVFSAGVNLYFMGYKNQLVPTGQLSDTGNAVSVNVPRSYRTGIEVEWALRPVGWFQWHFTGTLSRNKVRDFTEYIYEDEWTNPITYDLGDTPLAFSPDFTCHNSLDFTFGNASASLQSRYVSKQYLTNAGSDEAMLDAYFVSDLFLGYTFRKPLGMKEMKVGFTIYNLFNEKYESNGYAGAGYYVDNAGEKVIYRYAGYAAQAPVHVMGTLSLVF